MLVCSLVTHTQVRSDDDNDDDDDDPGGGRQDRARGGEGGGGPPGQEGDSGPGGARQHQEPGTGEEVPETGALHHGPGGHQEQVTELLERCRVMCESERYQIWMRPGHWPLLPPLMLVTTCQDVLLFISPHRSQCHK